MRDTVELEKLGVPTVMVTTSEFAKFARNHAKLLGMPGLRFATLPEAQVHLLTQEELREQAKSIIIPIIKGLSNTQRKRDEEDEVSLSGKMLIYTGSHYSEAYEKMCDHFNKNSLSDGLPVAPPTKEAVKWMLCGAKRPPEELIAELPPRRGIATVEMIAVNAVMAGCQPEHFPIVITAVEAMSDPAFKLGQILATSSSVAPLVIVHGPITKKLKINSGLGILGPGNRANMSIGRAVRLITITLAGSVSGETQMSTLGKWSSYCIAESDHLDIWEPYHMEKGLNKEDNAVTIYPVSAMQGMSMTGNKTAQELIAWMANTIGVVGPRSSDGWGGGSTQILILLNPLSAKIFRKEGWTKDDIRDSLYLKARVPFSIFKYSSLLKSFPDWVKQANDNTFVPVVAGPKSFDIIVGGGENRAHSAYFPSWVPQSQPVTKKIKE